LIGVRFRNERAAWLEGGLSFGAVLESHMFSKYSASWLQQQVMIIVLGLTNSLLLRFAFVAVPD
jgi:hypothetical protein